MSLLSLDGSELIGDRLVRKVYLDESGIGDATNEPVAVVSAVIVPVDRTTRLVRQYLTDMVAQHIPEQLQPGFRFHAMDLFQGGSLREHIPRERRYEILEELCSIPERFGLPITFGYCDRAGVEDSLRKISPTQALKTLTQERRESAAYVHAMAAYNCVMQVEIFMRFDAEPDEYAQLIFEDNSGSRSVIKRLLELMKQRRLMLEMNESLNLLDAPALPIIRIDEEHFFATKKESLLLQLADTCAYILRRKLANKECERFYKHLEPCLVEGSQMLLSESAKRRYLNQ